eukprot:m51a1_g12905 hypothetical protein (91) ;mRNA; f:1620-2229
MVKIKYLMQYTHYVIKFCIKYILEKEGLMKFFMNYIDDCIEAATMLEELYLNMHKFLESFLGFTQWLAPFIPNYTDVVAPLWYVDHVYVL